MAIQNFAGDGGGGGGGAGGNGGNIIIITSQLSYDNGSITSNWSTAVSGGDKGTKGDGGQYLRPTGSGIPGQNSVDGNNGNDGAGGKYMLVLI